MTNIKSAADFAAWAKNKPNAAVIAVGIRAALRSLPTIGVSAGGGQAPGSADAPDMLKHLHDALKMSIFDNWPSLYPSGLFDGTQNGFNPRNDIAALVRCANLESEAKSTELELLQWAMVSQDANTFDDGKSPKDLFHHPLWNGEAQESVNNINTKFLSFLGSAPQLLFWQRWFQGVLKGSPSGPIEREVASIPKGEWENGAEHIAQIIANIEADALSRVAPLAEEIDFDPDTARFSFSPRTISNQGLLSNHLGQISDFLGDALALGTNGLN